MKVMTDLNGGGRIDGQKRAYLNNVILAADIQEESGFNCRI